MIARMFAAALSLGAASTLQGDAFIYRDGAYTTAAAPKGAFTTFYDIDNSGRILGGSSEGLFVYDEGRYTWLDLPGGVGAGGGINDAGDIVGSYYVPSTFRTEAFLLRGDALSVISVPGARHSYASDINSGGQVAGFYIPASNPNVTLGFVASGGSYATFDFSAAGTRITGINDSGQMVGWYEVLIGNVWHWRSFLYDHGAFTPLSFPGIPDTEIRAEGINNSGEIVGALFSEGTGFVYGGGALTFLDMPRARYTYAYGINDAGAVVGYWEPPVPEPVTAALTLLGLAAMAGCFGMRRRTR